MATKRLKKEKIDVHPERVQNPYDKLKRSPGKFDQRVFTEQDLYGSNVNRFYNRLYSTQQHVQMVGFEKKIAEMRRRGTELRAQSEEIMYLNALRAALRKEKQRRENTTYQPQPSTQNTINSDITRAKTMPLQESSMQEPKFEHDSKDKIIKSEEIDKVAESNNVNLLPQAAPKEGNLPPQAVSNKVSPKVEQEKGPGVEGREVEDDAVSLSTIPSDYASVKEKKKVRREKRAISPPRLSMLEKLSFEIMTNTLPVNKLKRIIPDEQLPVQDKWPVLSNYRKQKVLPSVKEGKQQLAEDMSDLHVRLNKYFNCDNFPLTQYKYVAKAHPRKYRLLKAIETEDLSLPALPR